MKVDYTYNYICSIPVWAYLKQSHLTKLILGMYLVANRKPALVVPLASPVSLVVMQLAEHACCGTAYTLGARCRWRARAPSAACKWCALDATPLGRCGASQRCERRSRGRAPQAPAAALFLYPLFYR